MEKIFNRVLKSFKSGIFSICLEEHFDFYPNLKPDQSYFTISMESTFVGMPLSGIEYFSNYRDAINRFSYLRLTIQQITEDGNKH